VVLVASDLGPFEREALVESVVIAPGERYEVDVHLPAQGTVPMLNRVRALDHMLGTIHESVDTLGTYQLSPGGARPASVALHENAAVTAEIGRLARGLARAPDRTLAITMRLGTTLPGPVTAMLMGPALPAEWNDGMPMENWLTTARDVTWVLRDAGTGDENAAVRWRVRAGERKILRIVNDADAPHAMAHPIHLHGQRFVVLRRNGRAVPNRAWKDTVLVPAGETVDLLVDFTNPGEWMLHCHIAEHLGAGMMVHVTVDPAPRAGQH
jgi:FtsP/CotA-like multicopper oxidase with cupredoxin domain